MPYRSTVRSTKEESKAMHKVMYVTINIYTQDPFCITFKREQV